MLQSTWGLLEIVFGGSALGMSLAAPHYSVNEGYMFVWKIILICAHSMLVLSGIFMLFKKNFVVGVPVTLFALYCFVISVLDFLRVNLPSALNGNSILTPSLVSNGLLLLMGVMKLMRRS